MNLNSVEWSQAQELLLTLVRVLTPLTGRAESLSSFLHFRLYFPPAQVETQLQRSVSVLTTLCSVQAQVKEWIGEGSEVEKEEVRLELPLARQAQKLIEQVQGAIGKLCSSKHIKNPEAAPVRKTLQTLKPRLDQIVDMVRMSLPGAPFVSHVRPLSSARKKKKK